MLSLRWLELFCVLADVVTDKGSPPAVLGSVVVGAVDGLAMEEQHVAGIHVQTDFRLGFRRAIRLDIGE